MQKDAEIFYDIKYKRNKGQAELPYFEIVFSDITSAHRRVYSTETLTPQLMNDLARETEALFNRAKPDEYDPFIRLSSGYAQNLNQSHEKPQPVKENSAPDSVNHPPHYKSHPSGVECIQVTEHMSFCLGNVIKYLWRADHKGSTIEDLKKAKWYLEREIARRENGKK